MRHTIGAFAVVLDLEDRVLLCHRTDRDPLGFCADIRGCCGPHDPTESRARHRPQGAPCGNSPWL